MRRISVFQMLLALLFFPLVALAQQENSPGIVANIEMPEDKRAEVLKMVAAISEKIKSDPENLAHYHERAMLYMVLKRHREAIADYDLLIANDETNGVHYYFRALNKISLEDQDGACEDLKKARDLHYDLKDLNLMLICP